MEVFRLIKSLKHLEITIYFFIQLDENYGHTIVESLIAGTPVLLSKGTTPWDNIEDEGMGWLVPLSDIDLFVKKKLKD